MATSPHRSLRRWWPATHDLSGQGVGLYDEALLLVDAAHMRAGDHALLATARGATRYPVRHVASCPVRPASWRVRIERLELGSGVGGAVGDGRIMTGEWGRTATRGPAVSQRNAAGETLASRTVWERVDG